MLPQTRRQQAKNRSHLSLARFEEVKGFDRELSSPVVPMHVTRELGTTAGEAVYQLGLGHTSSLPWPSADDPWSSPSEVVLAHRRNRPSTSNLEVPLRTDAFSWRGVAHRRRDVVVLSDFSRRQRSRVVVVEVLQGERGLGEADEDGWLSIRIGNTGVGRINQRCVAFFRTTYTRLKD